MSYMKDYMLVKKNDFKSKRPGMDWRIHKTLEEQDEHFAEYMVEKGLVS